jgi:hypothetical protein
MFTDIIICFIWEEKLNIIASIFLSLTIYSYFYRKKKVKREIIRLKRESIILEVIKNNLITAMSDQEKYSIKEMFGQMSEEFKDFKTEIRADIKEMIQLFHDYKLSNNERISLLEGNHKVTKKELAIYLSIGLTFVMLAINIYISFKK